MPIFVGRGILVVSLLLGLLTGCNQSQFTLDKKTVSEKSLSSLGRLSVGGTIGGSDLGTGGGGTIGSVESPTPTPTATIIATPTPTPAPTATVIVTPTPTPTATILPPPPPPVNGACGNSNGQRVQTAPSSNLCAVGAASGVSLADGKFNWSCVGTNGGSTAQCSATQYTPVNGVCGGSHGQTFTSTPSSNLCAAGAASGVSVVNGRFVWSCAGSDGGATANCSAVQYIKSDGVCGSAKGQAFRSKPTENLCATGTASVVYEGSSGFNWSCSGVNGGRAVICNALRIVDAECGSANGQSHLYPPGMNLCAKGDATPVNSGAGGFTWSCRGLNGGSSVNCSGTISTVQPTDIPLWQRCQQRPVNDNWYDKYIEAHDPANMALEFRRTTDLSVVCRIDKVAIGNLSKYGRSDVASIDMTIVKEKCGTLLNRAGANEYRVFIQDLSRYKEISTAPYISSETNLLMMGIAQGGSQGNISGYHEDGNPRAPGFKLIRYNSQSAWCLARSVEEGQPYAFVDCGDKVADYLRVSSDRNGSISPLPGGNVTRDGEVWSFALSIIDSNSNMDLLDPNLGRISNRCQAMGSPLVIDTRVESDTAVPMTSVDKGVPFDLLGENSFPYSHAKMQTAWVSDPRIMFLVLPNAKGEVNGINEMFGDNTMGADGNFAENGYLALAKYKQSANDTAITKKNPIFKKLRLWSDKNLDGKVQKGELLTLRQMKIKEIKLGYDKNYVKADQHGNHVRYRSEVVLTNKKTLPMYDLYFQYHSLVPESQLTKK